MQIISGKIQSAQKVVIYGPEGIGKSTFASKFPNPVFIDTEGSTKHMDVARTPTPSSWTMLLDQVRYFRDNPGMYKTLVIDTADWAEWLCTVELCATKQVKSIEDFGYGKGYVYLSEKFGILLNLLNEIIKAEMNVVITAHATMRKFEQPDEMGGYDRWEMKLQKKTFPLLKEWADMVLFANYKTHVINVDNQGATKGKNKVQGGKRVMYTSHHPCWDAKNRHGLPDELPLDYSAIVHCIETAPTAVQPTTAAPEPQPAAAEEPRMTASPPAPDLGTMPPAPEELDQLAMQEPPPEPEAPPIETPPPEQRRPDLGPDIPQALRDLMASNDVTITEIQEVVAVKEYYTEDTPIQNYDPDFITGVLVAAWPKVFDGIKQIRQSKN